MNTKPTIPTEELVAEWLFNRYAAVSDWHGCSEQLRNEWRSDARAVIKASGIEALEAALGKLEHLIARQAFTGGKP